MNSILGQKTRQKLQSKKTRVYAQKPRLRMLFKNSISAFTFRGQYKVVGVHLNLNLERLSFTNCLLFKTNIQLTSCSQDNGAEADDVLPEAGPALRQGDKRQVQGHVLQVSHPSVKKKNLFLTVLRIRNVYPESEFFSIPDPRSASKNFQYFNPKNCF